MNIHRGLFWDEVVGGRRVKSGEKMIEIHLHIGEKVIIKSIYKF
jgi:hypothetical protein